MLLQVDVSNLQLGKGMNEQETLNLLKWYTKNEFKQVKIVGIMTIAPKNASVSELHRFFSKTRQFLHEKIMPYLEVDEPVFSAGMSNDYKIAIEEGSTMIRLGTALLGPRPQ